jgi:hypothetical protein
MKRTTITYTRQTAETPWYWQVVAFNTLDPARTFINDNPDDIETYAYAVGNENIVTFTFKTEAIQAEFQALIDAEIKTDYLQYCEDNNITINVVTEDI